MKWCALMCVAACHGGSNNNGNSNPRLKASLDLTHVIGFAIANQTSMRDCMPSTLYALQDNGDMVVTTVTEVPGMGDAGVQCSTTMQTEMATALYDTPKYDVITYQQPGLNHCDMAAGSAGCQPCPYVVLRKSDGALFCGIGGVDVRRVAGEADVLYLGVDSLVRLDMTTDPPTSTVVDDSQQTGDHFNTFDVNAANDAFAAGSFGARIFKANGGLQNITAQMEADQWVDPSGVFGYSLPVNNGSAGSTFDTYRLTPGSYAQTLVGSVAAGGILGFALATSTQVYGTTFVNGTVPTLVDLTPSAAGGVCGDPFMGVPLTACTDDTPCTGTCSGAPAICQGGPNAGLTCGSDAFCTYKCQLSGANHTLVGGPAMIRAVVSSGSQIYVQGTDGAGNGSILGIDASAIQEAPCATGVGACTPGVCCSDPITVTTLLAAGAYTVNALSLSRTGELTFAGLRNADGAKVVGNCVSGTCTVLNATAPSVSALQRIN